MLKKIKEGGMHLQVFEVLPGHMGFLEERTECALFTIPRKRNKTCHWNSDAQEIIIEFSGSREDFQVCEWEGPKQLRGTKGGHLK